MDNNHKILVSFHQITVAFIFYKTPSANLDNQAKISNSFTLILQINTNRDLHLKNITTMTLTIKTCQCK